jgi:hypothetical protein
MEKQMCTIQTLSKRSGALRMSLTDTERACGALKRLFSRFSNFNKMIGIPEFPLLYLD